MYKFKISVAKTDVFFEKLFLLFFRYPKTKTYFLKQKDLNADFELVSEKEFFSIVKKKH